MLADLAPPNGPLRTSRTLQLWNVSFIALGTALCWILCTIAQLQKYLSGRLAVSSCLLGGLAIAGLVFGLVHLYRRGLDVPRWTLIVALMALLLSFAVVYPVAQKHILGKGSDREDALRVELVALVHHQYPYDARTFLNHRPTPLPGAMVLAFPFFLLGRIALQNLVWASAFCIFLLNFFSRRATALAFVLIFLITALENLNDFDVGGDYMTNIMYVAIALYLFYRALLRSETNWASVLSIVLLGIALSSRVVYAVTLVPVFALALQRTGWRRALKFTAGVIAVSLLVTLPVFAPHPVTRLLLQLNQNADKFDYLPSFLPPVALPLSALCIVCSSFFVRMTLPRVYLISGLATFVMVGPPMLSICIAQGLSQKLPTDLEYLAVSCLFVALWLFSRLERVAIGNGSLSAGI
jgi:hypothetical protein